MQNDLVQRAKSLAHRAHAGQVDKAGRPYIEHVARVAAAVSDDPVAEAVAWLHDVIEDCGYEKYGAEILFSFPCAVHIGCMTLSRNTFRSEEDYYGEIMKRPKELRVKLADIADNSSEERLALLDEKTAARLRRKYAKAIAALTGGEA